MNKFKLADAKVLENSVSSIDNPVLKRAAMMVIEGEMAGWTQWGSWISFARAVQPEIEQNA